MSRDLIKDPSCHVCFHPHCEHVVCTCVREKVGGRESGQEMLKPFMMFGKGVKECTEQKPVNTDPRISQVCNRRK